MKIISARPGRAPIIGHVDVETSPGIKLYGLRVSRADDGSFRVFGLSNDHGRTCAFSRDAINVIASETLKFMTMNGLLQNDQSAAA